MKPFMGALGTWEDLDCRLNFSKERLGLWLLGVFCVRWAIDLTMDFFLCKVIISFIQSVCFLVESHLMS